MQLEIEVEAGSVIPPTRKLRVNWTAELDRDLRSYHFMDAERELVSLMGAEIAKSIDKELFTNGAKKEFLKEIEKSYKLMLATESSHVLNKMDAV